MRYAIIDGGTVANIVVADPAFAADQGWIEAGPDVAVGWTWDGETFAAPAPPSPEELRALIPPVTRRQARLALLGAGLLDDAEAALNNLDEPQRTAALIEWQDASVFQRDHPLIAAIGGALGLSESQVDDLFTQAAAL